MIKILFLIPNLGHGGAEKVLVNLVNNLDKTKFNVTIMALYDDNGVNKTFLSSDVTYRFCFRKSFLGVGHVLKLFSPEFLYKKLIRDDYDIVVSFLEGQTARIVSGCNNRRSKKICWIHRTMKAKKDASLLFCNYEEALDCYSKFDKIIFVSQDVQLAFMNIFPLRGKGVVCFNTNQTDKIIEMSKEEISNIEVFREDEFRICAMGSLIPVKGFERLLEIHKKLYDMGNKIHTYILGEGKGKSKLVNLIQKYNIQDTVTLLGYQENPYCYMKQCDIFVCSSYSEGFSTAVTEALVLGIPVVTTNVSGMQELLGSNNEYGIITENATKELMHGIQRMMESSKLLNQYKRKASERGRDFQKENTVKVVEDMLLSTVAKKENEAHI